MKGASLHHPTTDDDQKSRSLPEKRFGLAEKIPITGRLLLLRIGLS